MRKAIMNIVLTIALSTTGMTAYSGDLQNEDIRSSTEFAEGTLYVNGSKIDADDSALFYDRGALFPMRRVFESLGAQVEWNEQERSTYIKYNGEEYVFKIVVANKSFPERESLTVQNVKNIGSNTMDAYISLNPMGILGSFCIIDDYTYLHEETGKRLFEALGCKIEIDADSNRITVDDHNYPTDKAVQMGDAYVYVDENNRRTF